MFCEERKRRKVTSGQNNTQIHEAGAAMTNQGEKTKYGGCIYIQKHVEIVIENVVVAYNYILYI